MNQEKYIAAIEIGSSKISVAAARLGADGRLSIVAVEQEHTLESVSHGEIRNLEETASAIARLVERLEARTGIAPRRLTQAWIGLCGRSLRNIPRAVSINLPEETEITESILQELRAQALRSNIDHSLEVIEAVPATYFLGKTETRSAIGNLASSITANYQLVAARPNLRKNLEKVVRDKAGIPIAGITVTPLAVGDLILKEEEKRLGCMLVDLGAETTTVAIYQKGTLHYLAVLPMGGRNITADITRLGVLEERAEEIKQTSGCAIASENPSTLNLEGVKLSDVASLVSARAEEIVANIVEQIAYASLTEAQLPGGIVAIGGGFNLNRMAELLRRQSNLPVRRGSLPAGIDIEDTKAPTYETIEVAALLHRGADPSSPDCMEVPRTEELPVGEYEPEPEEEKPRVREPQKPRGPSFLDRLKSKMAKMVSGSDDDDDVEIE